MLILYVRMLGVATDVDVPCGEVVCGGLWICMPRNIPSELMWFATKPMFLANSKSYEFCITCDNQHQSVIWICAIEVSRIEYCYGIGMLQLKSSVSDVESIVLNFYLVWFSLVWLFVCCSISLPLSLSLLSSASFVHSHSGSIFPCQCTQLPILDVWTNGGKSVGSTFECSAIAAATE